MKILYFSFFLVLGGIETGLADLFTKYPDSTAEHCLYAADITPRVQKKLEDTGAIVKNRFATSEEREKYFVSPNRYKVDDFNNAFLNMKKIIEQEKPDVIRVCNDFDVIPASMASLATGVPVVSTFHHPPTDLCQKLNIHDRPLLQKGLEVGPYYAVSDYSAQYLSQHYLGLPPVDLDEEQPIGTLFNGVDLAQFSFSAQDRVSIRAQWEIPESALVIGSVSRIRVFWKRQDWIVSAVAYLHKCGFKNVYGMIVGSGPDLQKLKKFAKKNEIEKFIVFTGLQEDPAPYYSAFDIFAHPSKMESFGRVIVEALGCNLPTIICTPYEPRGTSADGYNIVKNGYNGLVVHADNKKGFIEGLELLVSNKELRQHFSSIARASIEKLDVSNMVERYYEIFTDLALSPHIPQPEKLEEFFSLIAERNNKNIKSATLSQKKIMTRVAR